MKKILLAFAMVICSLLPLTAQNNIRITGTVLDKADNDPIEQAGIRILREKDSTYVKGLATDDAGKFLVTVSPGKYIINVSYLGYKESFINVDASKKSVVMDNIFLSADGIMLSEAVVTAKAAEIAIKGDTIEYNADSYKVQPSAVVEDLLKKMPGAEVDSEGKITINGKEIKKILVDGKEFFTSDPKVASKNLPAAMVDKLQVLDRKSDMSQMTGFDDGEDETVINLTIKKNMKQGMYGSATSGLGSDDRYGVSGIANYMRNDNQFTLMGGSNNTNNEGFTDNAGNSFRGLRTGGMNFGGGNGITESTTGGFNFSMTPSDKLKWGGNTRVGTTENDLRTNSRVQFITNAPKGNQFQNTDSKGINNSDNAGADLRFEWTPDSLTKVIFSPSLQYGKNKTSSISDFLTTYENVNDSLNWGNSTYFSEGESRSANARLEVSRKLGKKGRVLSFSISGGFNDLDNDIESWSKKTMRLNSGRDSLSLIDIRTNQDNQGYNWRAYLSYVEPIGKNNFIQFNYSFRKNYSVADQNTYRNDGLGNYTIIDTTATKDLKNIFINQEISLNFKSVRAKYNYTVGVMLQPSKTDNWIITPNKNDTISNNVLNYAPVAQFNYLWDKRHNLRIDYSGTTTQPTTTQLSSVRDESNPLRITYGNPNLKPTFSNRFRIRYQKFNPEKASAIMVFGGFDFASNDIVSRTYSFEGGRQESTFDNINGNWSTNLRLIMNRPLRNKKFSVNSMTFGNYTRSNGYIDSLKNTANILNLAESLGLQYRSELFDFGIRGNIRYTTSNNSLNSNLNQAIYNYGGSFNTTWYLPYNLIVDTDLNYSANAGTTQGFELNEWLWNASMSKQVFRAKNGTIKFSIYDILHQKTNISQSLQTQSNSETITNVLESYFMVSFIYRFQIFKGGAKMTDMNNNDSGPRFGPPGGGGRSPRRL
ncbi:outer membrane receptor protein involved in Fe transport [Dysgonomonas alginatilytica]|uniref:Outer membrane receptor protein involved in Fe transport n=1 Tax=Dysgonomonas alginatilytica TaxID=1605892 RepID=A0A2V3PRC6_9BACT|nr:TonB-dependent receptor [Dysgonomonas alginatilytica]PXV67333.1 outer membrane receptor protein involved in Fe transport [Dysgonomonas alginatilytica]